MFLQRLEPSYLAATLGLAVALWPAATAAGHMPSPAPAGAHHTPVYRIVTLAPHITELLFEAGAGDLIVGTVNSSDYPPQARSLPKVGDGLHLDIERLIALHPTDLVAWQAGGAVTAVTPLLEPFSVRIHYSAPHSLQDIANAVDTLGDKFGTTHVARTRAAALRAQAASIAQHYAHRPPVRVFLEIGSNPLYTLADDALTNDVLAHCGAVNIFADAPGVAPQINPESVLARQPDAVIVSTGNDQKADDARRYWKSLGLAAARNGHVIAVSADAFVRPGPRLFQATQTLCEQIDQARAGG